MDSFRNERDALARITRLGIGATAAGGLYWLAVERVVAAHGVSKAVLAWVLTGGALAVLPLGYVLNRLAGGDLLARGHPWSGLLCVLVASEFLGWPIMGVLLLHDPGIVLFAMAALLGVHFLPLAWLYRFWPYAVLGIASVVGAAILQVARPAESATWIPLGMSAGYALSAVAAYVAIRRRLARPVGDQRS